MSGNESTWSAGGSGAQPERGMVPRAEARWVGEGRRFLADQRCRTGFRHLVDHTECTVTVVDRHDLVAATEPTATAARRRRRERTSIDVEYVQRPSPTHGGVVEYEPDSGRVRYCVHPRLESLRQCTDGL